MHGPMNVKKKLNNKLFIGRSDLSYVYWNLPSLRLYLHEGPWSSFVNVYIEIITKICHKVYNIYVEEPMFLV